MPGISLDWIGSLALFGSVVCWGLMPVLLKLLTAHVDPWVANGLRYPLAAVLYWPLLAAGMRTRRVHRGLFRQALAPALFSFAGQVLWAVAPYHLPANLIGFLLRLSVFWALGGAMILFPDERRLLGSGKFYLGMALAVGGFITLSAPGLSAGGLALSPVGLWIMLGCSFFFGCYGVSVRRCLGSAPPILAFGIVCQYVAAGTLALMFLNGNMAAVPGLSWKAWTLIAVSSFLGIALSHVLYYVALQRVGAAISSQMNLLASVVAMISAYLVLGESMGLVEIAGGLTVLAGGMLLILAQESLGRPAAAGEATPDVRTPPPAGDAGSP